MEQWYPVVSCNNLLLGESIWIKEHLETQSSEESSPPDCVSKFQIECNKINCFCKNSNDSNSTYTCTNG